MKEKILNALSTKFEGVSTTILGRIADKLAKTVSKDEEVTTAVEGVTWQKLLDAYGDSRATEAQQTAVRNYEQKHGLKDGKPVDEQKHNKEEEMEKEKEQEETPAWAQELVKANKALTDRLNAMEGERLSSERRAKLAAVTAALPETVRKAYGRTPVDSLTEEEFESLRGEITKEVEEYTRDVRQRGASFGTPRGQHAGAAKDEKLTEDQMKAISQRGEAVGEGQFF